MRAYVHVCVCVCVVVRACIRARVCVCMRAHVCVCGGGERGGKEVGREKTWEGDGGKGRGGRREGM